MIILKGRATNVSREQVRAFLYATLLVLGFHNHYPPILPLKVTLKKRLAGDCMGIHWNGYIELRASLDPENMLTTCVHEVIHACIKFPPGTSEMCTSTLCAKIKPTVAQLSEILLDGTYKRAAYLAHTKIHYRVKNGQPDTYNGAEDKPVGVVTKYLRMPRRFNGNT